MSVIWQPARQVTLEPGLPPYEVTSGYVIVSEHELPQAAGHSRVAQQLALSSSGLPYEEWRRSMEWTTTTLLDIRVPSTVLNPTLNRRPRASNDAKNPYRLSTGTAAVRRYC